MRAYQIDYVAQVEGRRVGTGTIEFVTFYEPGRVNQYTEMSHDVRTAVAAGWRSDKGLAIKADDIRVRVMRPVEMPANFEFNLPPENVVVIRDEKKLD